MIQAISKYVGLVTMGFATGTALGWLWAVGVIPHIIGAAALVVLGVSLWLFLATVADYGYHRPTARRLGWASTVAAVVLTAVVIYI